MQYKEANPGQPMQLKATEWNDVRKAAKHVLGNKQNVQVEQKSKARPDVGRILVRNTTETKLVPGSVVCLGVSSINMPPSGSAGPVGSNWATSSVVPRRIILDVLEPGESTRYAVLEDTLAAASAPGEGDGGVGNAIVSGAAYARLTADDDTATTASADPSGFTLVPNGDIQVLWVEDSVESERWAVVLMGAGGSVTPDYTLIEIGKGRSMTGVTTSPEIFGIRGFTVGDVTEVPTAAPDSDDFTLGDAAWPFGFAAGRVYPSGSYVWVAVKANAVVDSPLSIPQGSVAICRTIEQVAITGGGGATTPVYLTWRV